jgi:hypothetical protein
MDFGSSLAVSERLYVNKDLLATRQRGNESESLVIIPGSDFSFAAHRSPLLGTRPAGGFVIQIPSTTSPLPQLAASTLVRSTVGFRHQQAILAQRCDLRLPLTSDCFVFGVARLRFGSRAASRGNRNHLERVIETLANEIDAITDCDPFAGRRALAVQPHVPARHGSRSLAACLEEAAAVQPAIDAQSIHVGSCLPPSNPRVGLILIDPASTKQELDPAPALNR